MLLEVCFVVAVLVLFVALLVNRPFARAARVARMQAHVVANRQLGQGDVYRSLEVGDGPLLTTPLPGVTTLFDIFQ